MSDDLIREARHHAKYGSALAKAPDLLHRLADALEAARESEREYALLLELQQRREQPWIEAWQAETGKHSCLPDYGEMLEWLYSKANRAQAAEAQAERLAEGLGFAQCTMKCGEPWTSVCTEMITDRLAAYKEWRDGR